MHIATSTGDNRGIISQETVSPQESIMAIDPDLDVTAQIQLRALIEAWPKLPRDVREDIVNQIGPHLEPVTKLKLRF